MIIAGCTVNVKPFRTISFCFSKKFFNLAFSNNPFQIIHGRAGCAKPMCRGSTLHTIYGRRGLFVFSGADGGYRRLGVQPYSPAGARRERVAKLNFVCKIMIFILTLSAISIIMFTDNQTERVQDSEQRKARNDRTNGGRRLAATRAV